jgi:hypothetical protein
MRLQNSGSNPAILDIQEKELLTYSRRDFEGRVRSFISRPGLPPDQRLKSRLGE